MRNKLKILIVVGARPNFIKIAPLISEMKKYPKMITPVILHTGQHYNKVMSRKIFKDLDLPKPDICLNVGSGSHAKQTAEIMKQADDIIAKEKPNLILVVGDVNSTLACSLVAAKLQIPIAHVEAGLRSFNWEMPEEINRVLTDRISDFLFTTEKSANNNLIKEGLPKDKIFFVGNIIIDTLKNYLKKAQQSKILNKLKLKKKSYALLTLHRPEIVDKREKLYQVLEILKSIGQKIPIVFLVHPRTKQRIKEFKLSNKFKIPNLIMSEAVGYLDFLNLESNAKVVLTDSGGVQEETTILRVPCLTLRQETERPITIELGTNIITGLNKKKVLKEINLILKNQFNKGGIPPLWDGKTAERIVQIIKEKR